jgi:hypothetical protein
MNQQNICLNVGCWTDIAEEWLNVDASFYVRLSKIPVVGLAILSALKAPQFPPSVCHGDLVKGLNLPPESCQLIFASHVLEHLSLEDFERALSNLYIYLKSDGILRIIVPDLAWYAKKYIQSLSEPEKSSQAATEFMDISFLGYRASRRTLYHRLQEILSNSRHQWMWDEPSLRTALEKQGFKDIKRCKYQDWSDPRFQLVEKKNRHYQSICVEATK